MKEGNTVGIIAPARKVNEEALIKAKTILESWGLQVVFGEHVFTQDHSYLSATDEHRRIDFQSMIDNTQVQALFCARGGYGSTRILDQIRFDGLCKNPKWIIGFSDITSIHLCLNKMRLESIHATMPILFSNEDQQKSISSLRNLLFGNEEPLTALPDSTNRNGEAEGELIGGNLSLLVDSLGTLSELDTKNRILVIEEVGEHYYKVDRMIVQLKRANKLSALSGLVVGHFTDITESTLAFGESVKQIIQHHTKEYTYPLAFNFPIGHQQPNMPFIQGRMAKLCVTKQVSELTYKSEDKSA